MRNTRDSSKIGNAPLADHRTLTDTELGLVTGGAFNAFANFGDIKGESTDKDHKDWIMLISLSPPP